MGEERGEWPTVSFSINDSTSSSYECASVVSMATLR
jgi:hypothetical protein